MGLSQYWMLIISPRNIFRTCSFCSVPASIPTIFLLFHKPKFLKLADSALAPGIQLVCPLSDTQHCSWHFHAHAFANNAYLHPKSLPPANSCTIQSSSLLMFSAQDSSTFQPTRSSLSQHRSVGSTTISVCIPKFVCWNHESNNVERRDFEAMMSQGLCPYDRWMTWGWKCAWYHERGL